MELEVTRLLTAALKDPTYGVNALLPEVPRSPPDAAAEVAGTFTVPLVVDIVNDVEDELIGTDQEPANSPALVVVTQSTGPLTLLQPSELQWETKSLQLGIAYAIRDVAPTIGRRYGLYTLRAARRCLIRYFAAARATPALRRENSIDVLRPMGLSQERVVGAIGRAALTGILRVTLHVRDTAP